MEGKGWVYAKDLQPGDEIRKANGGTGEVKRVKVEQSTQEMYNLTVDQAHTFYVGDGQWLAHNTICKGLSGNVVNDPEGEWLVDEAIRYHRAISSDARITIAVGNENGQVVVAINGNADSAYISQLERMVVSEGRIFNINPGNGFSSHAEQVLYDNYNLGKIGISNSGGPCPYSGGCLSRFTLLQAQGIIEEIYSPLVWWR